MHLVAPKSRKLHLSTTADGGHLRLVWLGVGSAFSNANFQTNAFLIKGSSAVLVDCGTLVWRALSEFGISATDIACVLPTHSHADHIGGLEELALKSRYLAPFIKGGAKGDHKPACLITDEYEHVLWNFSLRGGLAYSEEMRIDGTLIPMNFDDYFRPIRPHEVPGFDRPVCDVEFNGIHLRMMRTKHIPEQSGTWRDSFYSCGLVVDGRVMMPGDTRFDTELIRMFVTDKIEAIFHDCQSFKGGVHAGFEELKTLPADIKSRIWLVHLDDGMLRLDPTAAKAWSAATAEFNRLLSAPNSSEDAFHEARLVVHKSQRAARDAAEAVVKSAGFAGMAHDGTEAYYDFK